jgi:hypothetical protein
VLEKGVDDVLILFTQDGARRVHKLTARREEWPESLKKPELLCGARSDGHLGLIGFDFGKRAQQAGGGARGIEQDGCKRAAVVLVPCRWLQRIAAEHGHTIAKNLVAAGVCSEILVQVSYPHVAKLK